MSEASSATQLIFPHWLLTLDAGDTQGEQVQTGQAVALCSERILAVLPQAEARQRYPHLIPLELPDQLLLKWAFAARSAPPSSILPMPGQPVPMKHWTRLWNCMHVMPTSP